MMDLMDAPTFRDEPLVVIVRVVRAGLARAGRVTVHVPDPDLGAGLYAGERVRVAGEALIPRSYRVWCDLADRLEARLRTPRASDRGEAFVALTFDALAADEPWQATGDDRYGAASAFQRVHKLEEGGAIDYLDALERARPPAAARVLALGVNRGDDLAALDALDPPPQEPLSFVGVDRAASALALARARFPASRHRFIEADLNDLERLDLGRFELVLALGVLQSPGVDDRALLRALVQRHLTDGGALVVSLPNGRYRDGELVYGARVKNLREPELSLVVRDLAFYRRYLHQHRFRVFVTGKRELFLTAVPAARRRG